MVSNNNGLIEGGDEARWKDGELVDIMTEKMIFQLEGFAKDKKPFFCTTHHISHMGHGDQTNDSKDQVRPEFTEMLFRNADGISRKRYIS